MTGICPVGATKPFELVKDGAGEEKEEEEKEEEEEHSHSCAFSLDDNAITAQLNASPSTETTKPPACTLTVSANQINTTRTKKMSMMTTAINRMGHLKLTTQSLQLIFFFELFI